MCFISRYQAHKDNFGKNRETDWSCYPQPVSRSPISNQQFFLPVIKDNILQDFQNDRRNLRY